MRIDNEDKDVRMPDSLEKVVKADRIALRVTPQTKALLTAAARARHGRGIRRSANFY
jgi:hypothetical protein